jgi:hypothetical protein
MVLEKNRPQHTHFLSPAGAVFFNSSATAEKNHCAGEKWHAEDYFIDDPEMRPRMRKI